MLQDRSCGSERGRRWKPTGKNKEGRGLSDGSVLKMEKLGKGHEMGRGEGRSVHLVCERTKRAERRLGSPKYLW